MKATITVQMDNEAFTDYPASELARILRDLSEKVEAGIMVCAVMDGNGNRVGQFEVTDGN